MATNNNHHDSTVAANASPNKPEESPPLLKRSKTIAVDTSQTPHFPGPLFPAVRRLSSDLRQPSIDLRLSIDNDPAAPPPSSDTAQFFNRDYIFPSCLGPYASRSGLAHKAPKLANRRIGSARVQGTAVAPSPPIAPPLKVQESKKQEKPIKLIGRPDSGSQSSIRRFWIPTHYLVSVSIFFFLF